MYHDRHQLVTDGAFVCHHWFYRPPRWFLLVCSLLFGAVRALLLLVNSVHISEQHKAHKTRLKSDDNAKHVWFDRNKRKLYAH